MWYFIQLGQRLLEVSIKLPLFFWWLLIYWLITLWGVLFAVKFYLWVFASVPEIPCHSHLWVVICCFLCPSFISWDCSVRRRCCSFCSLMQYFGCHLPHVSPSFGWHCLLPVRHNLCFLCPCPRISQFPKQMNRLPQEPGLPCWGTSDWWRSEVPGLCCFLPFSVDR